MQMYLQRLLLPLPLHLISSSSAAAPDSLPLLRSMESPLPSSEQYAPPPHDEHKHDRPEPPVSKYGDVTCRVHNTDGGDQCYGIIVIPDEQARDNLQTYFAKELAHKVFEKKEDGFTLKLPCPRDLKEKIRKELGDRIVETLSQGDRQYVGQVTINREQKESPASQHDQANNHRKSH